MLKNANQQHIVILGGGTAGWMTAAALCKLLPAEQYQISLVESEQIGTVGVGEATVPHLRFFNHRLGIDEAEFIKATQATFKLGIEFVNWSATPSSYIHPFAEFGEPYQGIPFHQLWTKYQQQQANINIDEFSFAAQACYQNKFDFPSNDLSSLSSSYSYAYHINATAYAEYLRVFAEKAGVKRIEGKVDEVIYRASDQYIEQLILTSGQRISGDFFIDCSGFRSRLLGKVLAVEFEDWSHWLPCDSAIAMASSELKQKKPYTRSTAHSAGWQWQIPLQHRTGNGHVYASEFMSSEQALKILSDNIEGEALSEPNYLKFQTGKRKKSWSHNCVAIGLSSGFLEPLESTSIYLIQSAIMKLVELLPRQAQMPVLANEFNRCMDLELERIRDFLILHYCITGRQDSEFWRYCSNMSLPDSLAEKIDLFKHCGHIVEYEQGMFLEPSWVAVYLGQHCFSQHYDPRVEQLSAAELEQLMSRFKQKISKTLLDTPEHADILKKMLTSQIARKPGQSAAPKNSLYGARR